MFDEPTNYNDINRFESILELLCPGTIVHHNRGGSQLAVVQAVHIPLKNSGKMVIRREAGKWQACTVDSKGLEWALEHGDHAFVEVLRDAVGCALVARNTSASSLLPTSEM